MKMFYNFFQKISSRENNKWLLSICLALISAKVIASAGGGGGGGSSSDNGGIFEIIIYILWLIPFPWNLVVLAIIILLSFLTRKKVRSISGLNKIASFDDIDQSESQIPIDFIQRNPNWNKDLFNAKVQTAFMSIQDAWMKMDLKDVRKWITDGVWQRFNTQFLMMQTIGQKNTMSDIQIQKMFIADVQRDGNYDLIDVAIHFTMMDNFVTEKYPQLNTEGYLENVEYWTFIRKSGVAEKDMFHSENCPNCGAPLPKNMGEVGKCESCGTITTLGDYDWVLSEITQAADYANDSNKLDKNGKLTNRIRENMQRDSDFSVQFVEDKASNAYMQILSAQVLQKPERLRRFVNNDLFEKLSQEIKTEKPFAFNRLYLNNVTLMDFYQKEGKDNMVVAFKRTAQKVSLENNQLTLIDYAMYTTNEIMIMSRDIGAGQPKGSLYAHSCPSCGGPIKDTIDLKCQFCGSELNSTKNEWIITELMSAFNYSALANEQQLPLITHAGVSDLDPLFKVRDYAINNVMLIVFADGKFDQSELAFVMKLTKKLGYDSQKIAGFVALGQNRQLTLRLPEDKKHAQKVYDIMFKAANADGHLHDEEKAILDDVQARIAQMN
jgi:predicted lipid-binding transport protein (Tim44 family)